MSGDAKLTLSTLPKTWLLDLDGTLVKHNGYKIDGRDSWLPGALKFLKSLPETDTIIFLTSRTDEYLKQTKNFLNDAEIRYDYLISNLPYGERIIINDDKPSGLEMAFSINVIRNNPFKFSFIENVLL